MQWPPRGRLLENDKNVSEVPAVMFPDPITAIVRAVHITAAVVWLGFLYFLVFVRPKVMGGLPEETRRQVMPHLAKHTAPWLAVSATLTIVFGALLFADLGDRIGFENIGWGLNLAVALAFLMYVLGMAVLVPINVKVAKILQGGKPPSPQELRRAGQVGHINAGLSVVILFLMVASQRIAAFG